MNDYMHDKQPSMNKQFRKHILRRKNGIALTLSSCNFQKNFDRPQLVRPSLFYPLFKKRLSFEEMLAEFTKDKSRIREVRNRQYAGLREEKKLESSIRRRNIAKGEK